jgi:hypothetical protein
MVGGPAAAVELKRSWAAVYESAGQHDQARAVAAEAAALEEIGEKR